MKPETKKHLASTLKKEVLILFSCVFAMLAFGWKDLLYSTCGAPSTWDTLNFLICLGLFSYLLLWIPRSIVRAIRRLVSHLKEEASKSAKAS